MSIMRTVDESDDSFEEFMRRRQRASAEFLRGDTNLLEELLTTDTATFMPPDGRVITGTEPVRRAQVDSAAGFGPASTGHFDILDSGSSGNIGFWTGLQISRLDIEGQGMTEMTLRTTEVFRRENGTWRLVHRHADTIPTDNEK